MSVLVATIIPTSLAAACGSSDEPLPLPTPKTLKESLLAEMNKVRVNSNAFSSNHDDVAWLTSPALLPGVMRYLYLSGNYPTLYEAISAPTSAWVTALPTKLPYDPATRNLWVRAFTFGNQLSLAESIIDLTASSGVRTIKSLVDKTPEYRAIDLSSVRIGGQVDSVFIDASQVRVPLGARLTYLYRGEWLSAASYVDRFKSVVATPAVSEFDALTFANAYLGETLVRIEASSGDFIVSNPMPARPRIEITSYDRTNIPAALVNTVYQLTFAGASVHSNVQWSALPSLPQGKIKDIRFISGAYTAQADLPPLTSPLWTNALPANVSADHDSRNLWAYFEPVPGTFFSSDLFMNLTGSLKIRDIATLLDSNAEIVAADLAAVRISGVLDSAFIDEKALTIPKSTQITYQIGSMTNWLPLAAFRTYLMANSDSLKSLPRLMIRNRIESRDAQYVIRNFRTGEPNIEHFALTIGDLVVKQTQLFRLAPGATITNIIWNALPEPTYPILGFTYLSGDFPTKDAAAAASAQLWEQTPPRAVLADATKRFLWIRAELATDNNLSASIFDFSSVLVFS